MSAMNTRVKGGFDDQAQAKCLYRKCGKVFGNWWGLRAHYQISGHLELEQALADKEDRNESK